MSVLAAAVVVCYTLSSIAYLAFLFRQADGLNRLGFALLVAGFGLHSGLILQGFIAAGHLPVSNLRETLIVAAWFLAGVFILFQYRYNLKVMGVYTAPLLVFVMVVTVQLSTEPAYTPSAFNSFWLVLHIAAVFIGDAAFALACGIGIFYLVQEQAIKRKHHGFFFKRLPSLQRIDAAAYACLVIGFTLLTLGLMTGFVYARLIWGAFWSWDPKEVWSCVTWLLYATLLHGRLIFGWRGKKAAVMSIVGFGVLLFTFLGVNFWLKGHHGEFTRFVS